MHDRQPASAAQSAEDNGRGKREHRGHQAKDERVAQVLGRVVLGDACGADSVDGVDGMENIQEIYNLTIYNFTIMSEQTKERVAKARKARNRCTVFKWMTIVTGALALLLGLFAAIMPPPWEVHHSIISLIGEFMGIMAIFAALSAFESGRDAKLILGDHATLALDGNGDGKINTDE